MLSVYVRCVVCVSVALLTRFLGADRERSEIGQ